MAKLKHARLAAKALLIGGTLVLLSGCISNNVKGFTPDVTAAYDLKSNIAKKIALGDFTMPTSKDKTSILCRLSGEVYLPNKMSYSQYIKEAFRKILITANRYSTTHSKTHTISANIKDVDFSSVLGEWSISAAIKVDNHPSVVINSVTHFGTSYNSWSACRNVAESFQTATQDFISKVLHHSVIKRALNQ